MNMILLRAGLHPALAVLALIGLSLGLSPRPCVAENPVRVGNFSELTPDGSLPSQWQPLTFKKIERHTLYQVVSDGGNTVIRADSQNSASGLIRKISIDPRKFPIISWRWKVSSIYTKGDVTRKSGDDYPARIYITFAYDPAEVGFFERAKYEAARLIQGETPPLAAITYIWASQAPAGLTVANPYTDRVKMVVLQSGAARVNQWMAEKRNVYADYIAAFGKEPPMVSGVAIMTDSDNTGESARAWYGDIVFSAD